MDLNYLRRLLKIFDESTAVELEIEEEGVTLRMTKQGEGSAMASFAPPPYAGQQYAGQYMPQPPIYHVPSMMPQSPPVAASMPAAPVAAAPEIQAPPAEVKPTASSKTHQITSPIVGTFYRSPSPDTASFVQVGDRINAGSTLCIVEAMKLMNEIESDVSGTIVKILVENAQPVEYNQPLMIVELD